MSARTSSTESPRSRTRSKPGSRRSSSRARGEGMLTVELHVAIGTDDHQSTALADCRATCCNIMSVGRSAQCRSSSTRKSGVCARRVREECRIRSGRAGSAPARRSSAALTGRSGRRAATSETILATSPAPLPSSSRSIVVGPVDDVLTQRFDEGQIGDARLGLMTAAEQ